MFCRLCCDQLILMLALRYVVEKIVNHQYDEVEASCLQPFPTTFVIQFGIAQVLAY